MILVNNSRQLKNVFFLMTANIVFVGIPTKLIDYLYRFECECFK